MNQTYHPDRSAKPVKHIGPMWLIQHSEDNRKTPRVRPVAPKVRKNRLGEWIPAVPLGAFGKSRQPNRSRTVWHPTNVNGLSAWDLIHRRIALGLAA